MDFRLLTKTHRAPALEALDKGGISRRAVYSNDGGQTISQMVSQIASARGSPAYSVRQVSRQAE